MTKHILVISITNSVNAYALNECTSTMVCIWPDDGSVSRNMSPNF
jgi:hypothetical protein